MHLAVNAGMIIVGGLLVAAGAVHLPGVFAYRVAAHVHVHMAFNAGYTQMCSTLPACFPHWRACCVIDISVAEIIGRVAGYTKSIFKTDYVGFGLDLMI